MNFKYILGNLFYVMQLKKIVNDLKDARNIALGSIF